MCFPSGWWHGQSMIKFHHGLGVVIHAFFAIGRSPNHRLSSISGKMFIHASIDSVSYHPIIIVGSLRISFIVEYPSVMILPFILIAHQSEGVAISRYRSFLGAGSIIFGDIWIPIESLMRWTVATCTKVKNCTILHILGFGVVRFSLGFNRLT